MGPETSAPGRSRSGAWSAGSTRSTARARASPSSPTVRMQPGDLVAAGVAAGATSTRGPNFFVGDREAAYNAALVECSSAPRRRRKCWPRRPAPRSGPRSRSPRAATWSVPGEPQASEPRRGRQGGARPTGRAGHLHRQGDGRRGLRAPVARLSSEPTMRSVDARPPWPLWMPLSDGNRTQKRFRTSEAQTVTTSYPSPSVGSEPNARRKPQDYRLGTGPLADLLDGGRLRWPLLAQRSA